MPIERRRLGVMIAGASAFFDLYAPQSVLPQLTSDFGVDLHQAGWIVTASTLAVAAAGPFAGAAADLAGRKRLIAAGAGLMALPMLLSAFAGTFHELLVWRAAVGLLMPFVFCVAVAYIGEEWEAGDARAITALYMAGAVAGGFSGRFLCGLVTDVAGWRASFAALAAVNLAAGLALTFLLPRERSFVSGQRVRDVLGAMGGHLRRREILAACLVGLLILFAQVALFTYANLLLAAEPYGLGPGILGSISAVYLLGMVTTPVAGSRLRRFRESVPLAAGVALFVGGIALTLSSPVWVIVTGMALASAGTFLCQSAATSYVAAASPGARSTAVGLYSTFYYLGGSIGAVAPGFLWRADGWPAVVALLAASSVLSLLIASVFWRKRTATSCVEAARVESNPTAGALGLPLDPACAR